MEILLQDIFCMRFLHMGNCQSMASGMDGVEGIAQNKELIPIELFNPPRFNGVPLYKAAEYLIKWRYVAIVLSLFRFVSGVAIDSIFDKNSEAVIFRFLNL